MSKTRAVGSSSTLCINWFWAGLFIVVAGGGCTNSADRCEGVSCGDGESCVEGECVPPADPCEGVTCADGESCVEGNCVPRTDPCEGVTCSDGESCVDGACVPDVPNGGELSITLSS